MDNDRIKQFLAARKSEKQRPLDRMMTILSRLKTEEEPSKLQHNPPDHTPDTPDGNKPTIRRKKPGLGPSM